MKERPILFSGAMVRALLAGTKMQTRRVVKPQPHKDRLHRSVDSPDKFVCAGEHTWWSGNHTQSIYHSARCPYGQPGDRLWVRESFMPIPLEAAPGPSQTPWSIAYAAGGQTELLAPSSYNPTLYNYERWTPSIHMPRWASRITLEVTGVRVERLQDISADDARAEGCPDKPVDGAEQASIDLLAKLWYHDLWEQINGLDSWAANPWVWVVEFKRMKGDAA